MRDYRYSVCLGIVLAVSWPGRSAADLFVVRAPGELTLGVTAEGEVWFVPKDCDIPGLVAAWDTVRVAGKGQLQVPKGKWEGRVLGYQEGGKHEACVSANPWVEWELVKVPGQLYTYTLQAAGGKLAGWYLDLGPAVQVRGRSAAARTAYRAVLTKSPKKPLWLEFTDFGP
jgi:hypothetical protein